MLFDDIVSILEYIKSTQSNVYMDGEVMENVKPPFIVVKNASIGTEAFVDSSGTLADESFTITAYGLNAPLAKKLAIEVRNSLIFNQVGRLNIGTIELLESAVKLDEGFYLQNMRFRINIGESH